MKNPWLNYNFEKSTIHILDKILIDDFNLKVNNRFKFNNQLLPEPYIGNLNAKILLLTLNPGLSKDDFTIHADNKYKDLHRININQLSTDFPFYYLDPNLKSPGSEWWFNKLKLLIGKYDNKKISQSIYCLQYLPYHSTEFKKLKTQIPTQEYTKNVLQNHIKKNKPIIIMRSKTYWTELVPDLKNYKNTFILNNPRNPVLSPKNIGEKNFSKLLDFIN